MAIGPPGRLTAVRRRVYNRSAMTLAGWITLATIGIASILLVSEILRPDLTALLVMLTLAISGVITPQQALSGFSQPAVITILSIFILTYGLERTGVTTWIGHRLLSLAGESAGRLTPALMLTAAGLSTFMNSIAAAAVLLPTAMGISRQVKIRPSRLLMPLAFGALLGGTATLFTTANIIVSTTLGTEGIKPFGVLDFLPVGLMLVIAGTATVTLLAPRLLPSRDVGGALARLSRSQANLSKIYHLDSGTHELRLSAASPIAGRTLGEAGLGKSLGLTVLGIGRQSHIILAPDRDTRLEAGDILLIEGQMGAQFREAYGLESVAPNGLAQALSTERIPLVEVVLAPRSELVGRSLRQTHFRERYGLQVVALWRQGKVLQQEFSDAELRFGDAMLIQGPQEKIDLLRQDANFIVLQGEAAARVGWKAVLASGIMLFCLTLAATSLLPIALATLLGAALMVLSGCLRMDEAYRSVEWRAIFLIAGMLPLSFALEQTGTATILSEQLIRVVGHLGVLATGATMLLATIAVSLLVSGQAAAVILTPIALATSHALGADPRGMAMAVAIGCSLGFISPLGHPALLLVMGPGGYRFADYSRIGAPLTLVCVAAAVIGLHFFWHL
jgi:di/tricarboxylate transporter